MITVEKKLNIFSKLILEKEQNESDVKLEEMKKNNEKTIQAHKKKLEQKAKEIINNKVNKANMEKNAMMSKVTGDAKNKILTKKRELLERLMEGIRDKARLFTDTPEYEGYLQKSFIEVLSSLEEEQGVIIHVMQRDIERYKEKLITTMVQKGINQSDVDITPSTSDIIGGLLGQNKSQTIRIDATISTIIEDGKSIIGQILYEELKKAGDIDE